MWVRIPPGLTNLSLTMEEFKWSGLLTTEYEKLIQIFGSGLVQKARELKDTDDASIILCQYLQSDNLTPAACKLLLKSILDGTTEYHIPTASPLCPRFPFCSNLPKEKSKKKKFKWHVLLLNCMRVGLLAVLPIVAGWLAPYLLWETPTHIMFNAIAITIASGMWLTVLLEYSKR